MLPLLRIHVPVAQYHDLAIHREEFDVTAVRRSDPFGDNFEPERTFSACARHVTVVLGRHQYTRRPASRLSELGVWNEQTHLEETFVIVIERSKELLDDRLTVRALAYYSTAQTERTWYRLERGTTRICRLCAFLRLWSTKIRHFDALNPISR